MLPIAPDTVLQQRYRIVKMLGEGRFGRTYLAVDLGRADAYCAIEELAPFAQFSSAVTTAKAIFKQEATLLYQLQHPQVPRFWTTFEEQNRLLLVRDYIIGKTYRTLLDELQHLGRTFSETEVWQFLIEILPAISYIHSKGTIHRDLSPEHIICRDSDRLPCPIDFGIVKEFTNKLPADPATARIAVGQAGYAPAEQIQRGQIYPNSDLYTLAVTAIVLLTGKEPSALFQSEQMNWQWRKWTEIDDGFADILRRMLNSQPNERYQSATEVMRDLQGLEIAKSAQFEDEAVPNLLSPVQAVTVAGKSAFSVANRIQTAISNLDVKSVWEKPIVFIPLGILIAILAGVGSWFGVTQLLHNKPENPVATTPPKQIDFNNPTIPTATPSPIATTSDIIQPEMDRAIEKEGKVDATTPVIYKFAAIAGANLDIQLLPLTTQTPDPRSINIPIDPTIPKSSPIPTQPKGGKSAPMTIPVTTPTPAPAKVLMTIISPTGSPIDDKADRILSWRGQLSMSGNYTIELRPIAGFNGSSFPYKLSVTQLATIPMTLPATSNPAGITPPLNMPIPSNGSGLNAIPNLPPPTLPNNDLPSLAPIPLPKPFPAITPATPSESERPAGKRKRNQTAEPSTPPVNRKRIDAGEEATPPARKKRSRIETTEETNSAPRNRRNRQTQAEPKPDRNPSTKPDSGENKPNTSPPKQEEQIPILIPEPKTDTPPPAKTDPNPTAPFGGTNDPD
jgi:serine/threonine protein kinase